MNERYYNVSYAESPFGTLNEYMTKTFGWMFLGLIVSFAVAIGTAFSGLGVVMASTGIIWVAAIVEIVLVVILSSRVMTLRPATATGLFFGYAVLNGINLSTLFYAYRMDTLVFAFLVGALYFGIMAVYGWRTGKDLTGWGPKLMGGLIALILISLFGGLFGMLFHISFGVMDLLYCAVSLVLFMALTAYDTQMLRHHYAYFGGDAAMLHKSAILGALSLYLDFINIFLYVLRIMARDRD